MRTDAELVQAYRDGDRDSLEALLRRYQPSLFSFVRRKLGSTPLAEDALQETYVKVMKHIHRYKEEGHFKAWLYTIAHREAMAQVKKVRHHEHLDTTEEFKDYFQESSGSSPARALNKKNRTIALEKALQSLNEQERDVVLLRLKDDLRFKDIATITDAPLNTVLSRMRSATDKLRASLHLKEYADEL